MINEIVQSGVWILLPFVAGVATGVLTMALTVSMMGRSEEEMDCEDCEVVKLCRRTFGKYWEDKSNGGKGCRHPLAKPKGEDDFTEDLQQARPKALRHEALDTPSATAERTEAHSPSRTSYRQEELI